MNTSAKIQMSAFARLIFYTRYIQHISIADCQIIYYQQKYQEVYQFKLILLPNHPVLYPAESQSGSQAAAEHV